MLKVKKEDIVLTMRIVVLGLLSLLLLASDGVVGAAQSAASPLWNVGDYWQYAYTPSTNVTTMVEAITHSISYLMVGSTSLNHQEYNVLFTTFETVQGPLPQLYLNPKNVLSDGGIVPVIEVGFPLEVGQMWTRQAAIGGRTLTLSAHVVALETVSVGAGTFQAYYLQYKEDGHLFAELWYSPVVESFIKRCNMLAPASADFSRSDFLGIRIGAFSLQQVWRFPEDVALQNMFGTLEQAAAGGRVDVVLPILEQLIKYDIAAVQATALEEELLSH